MVDRAELVMDPPPEAAMLVSDAIHQARAALDNLVNALRPDGPAPRVSFPIRQSEAEYNKVARDALRGVPDWARDVIRAKQPFETSDDRRWAGDSLPHLHELARIDRHRLPPIHAAVVLPDYATGDTAQSVRAQMDSRGRWAEWEYDDDGGLGIRTFRVQVLFGSDAGQPDRVEVGEWTRSLVMRAEDAVRMVVASDPAG